MVKFYNLYVIISVGYRVKSIQGTRFRQWATGRPLLKGAGSISHEEAMDKALFEYRKYQVKTLTPVEEAYLESINSLGKLAKRKGRQHGDNH